MKLLKKLERVRTKQGRFPDDGLKGIGIAELQRMPEQSHLSCPQCQSAWFGVSGAGFATKTGCRKCGWESIIHIPLTSKDFTGVCPSCNCPWFAIIKFGDKVAIGCQRCKWETVSPITRVTSTGLILPN